MSTTFPDTSLGRDPDLQSQPKTDKTRPYR